MKIFSKMLLIFFLIACSGKKNVTHDTQMMELHDHSPVEYIDELFTDAEVGEDIAGEQVEPIEQLYDAEEDLWQRYDGRVPEIEKFSYQDHIASCVATRACFPENPQQLATCTSAYAHIVGREPGIVLQKVASCVIGAGADCVEVRKCIGNGSEPMPCTPLETPDRCESAVLYQCSRASGLTFVFDCSSIGMQCYINDDDEAVCGLGSCNEENFWSTCHGSIIIYCDSSVITVSDCESAGLKCVEDEEHQARCAASDDWCDEEKEGRHCEGNLIVGCIGGGRGSVDCSKVIPDWRCGPTEGTYGCVPPGDECTAYPLFGSDMEEDCNDDNIVTCLNGYITEISCLDYGFGECVDIGRAARCRAP